MLTASAASPPADANDFIYQWAASADYDPEPGLEKITAAAFGQRRKMLRASLKALGGEPLIAAAGLDPQARAETVDVDGFLRLADAWIRRRS